jgi:hypothetical protein
MGAGGSRVSVDQIRVIHGNKWLDRRLKDVFLAIPTRLAAYLLRELPTKECDITVSSMYNWSVNLSPKSEDQRWRKLKIYWTSVPVPFY